jgi:hypothetical protein
MNAFDGANDRPGGRPFAGTVRSVAERLHYRLTVRERSGEDAERRRVTTLDEARRKRPVRWVMLRIIQGACPMVPRERGCCKSSDEQGRQRDLGVSGHDISPC